MSSTKLVWVTPESQELIGWMARVSNPKALKSDPVSRLLGYLIRNKHWSPFEMANLCVEIVTTRDIARQILRHRAFHYQEFSQRYAEVEQTGPVLREPRTQDTTNRQNSFATTDASLSDAWVFWQNKVWDVCWTAYQACLKLGIAKEVARALLPEGLTTSKMYMNGTIRDWIHYLSVRLESGTQKEHREVAQQVLAILEAETPGIIAAAREAGLIPPKVKERRDETITYSNV